MNTIINISVKKDLNDSTIITLRNYKFGIFLFGHFAKLQSTFFNNRIIDY